MLRSWQQIFILLGLVWACSSHENKQPSEVVSADGSESAEESSGKEDKQDDNSSLDLSDDYRPFYFSEGNNAFTSKTVNKKIAKGLVNDLEDNVKKATAKDTAEVAGFITVQVLADESLDAVIRSVKKLIDLEMRKDVAREIPDIAKLQLVLAAINAKNFALAEYYLPDLLTSKNKWIKAAAMNADAFIALEDDRLPEAIATWNSVLKTDSENEAARLNIGFFSLKYGDYATAIQMLGPMEEDWFALYGLLVAERLAGNTTKVAALCEELEDKKKDYKPAMMSCALNAYQGEKKHDKAIALLNTLVKAEPSIPQLDEKAYKLISDIEENKQAKKVEKKPSSPPAEKKEEAPPEDEGDSESEEEEEG
ncbi:MAG: hypothetical protein AB7T49_11780 [Oligoflexales bacterium]